MILSLIAPESEVLINYKRRLTADFVIKFFVAQLLEHNLSQLVQVFSLNYLRVLLLEHTALKLSAVLVMMLKHLLILKNLLYFL